jgi:apolipoprotein N-acyltransferase
MLVVVSAGLQVLIFPTGGPLPAWRCALAWIALTPLLLALLAPCADGKQLGWRRGTLLAYACGILWYAGGCYWIYQTMYLYGGMGKPLAFVILILFSLYLGLYHALFGFLLWVSARRGVRFALLAAPMLWVAVELARAHVTSFPWDQLGMSQVDSDLTRLAPLAGVYGISFLLLAVNAVLASTVLLSPAGHFLRTSRWKLLLCLLLVAVTFPVQPDARRATLPTQASAVLLQPNAVEGDDREWFGGGYEREIQQYQTLSEHPPLGNDSRSSVDVSRSSVDVSRSSVNVIIWPESSSPLFAEDPRFQFAAHQLATQIGSALILGDVARASGQGPAGHAALYNSASFFTPDGKSAGRYDKIHLVPFGEYIPFQEFLTFAKALTAEAGDMTPGRDRVMFHTGGHTYGVFICYESIFADEVRLLAKHGADVLVNISDDGWYGDTSAPWQHLNMARMRAIENHRWLLRDTNSGVTAVIDPQGHLVAQAPRHIQTAIRVPFAFEQGTTFYTRHGDWFAYAVTILGVLMLGFAFLRPVKS